MKREEKTETWTYKLMAMPENGKPKPFIRDTPDAAYSLTVLASSLNKRKGKNFSCSVDKDNPCIVLVTSNPPQL